MKRPLFPSHFCGSLLGVAGGLCLALVALIAFAPLSSGQGERRYTGVASCDTCHGSQSNQYGLINAFYTWAGADEHSKAYRHLTNAQSDHIGGLMGLPLEADRATWTKCTRCHVMDGAVPAPESQYRIDEGIGCEGCHGPAESWLASHKERDATHQKNVANGMTDLKDLRTRTRLCVSCHMGLDHEIVAAGHPDLNFELLHFSFWQPPHWNYTEASPLKYWAIGQVVALEKATRDLANEVELYMPIPVFESESCYQCHHKLPQDRWRQVEGHASVVAPLSQVLLGEQAASELKERFLKVEDSVLGKPGDRRGPLGVASRELAEYASALVDEVSSSLSAKAVDPALVRELLVALTSPLPEEPQTLHPELPTEWVVDHFNSAELIYYAIKSLSMIDLSAQAASGPTTDGLIKVLKGQESVEGFEKSLEKVFTLVGYRKVGNRKAAFKTEEFNKNLEALKEALPK